MLQKPSSVGDEWIYYDTFYLLRLILLVIDNPNYCSLTSLPYHYLQKRMLSYLFQVTCLWIICSHRGHYCIHLGMNIWKGGENSLVVFIFLAIQTMYTFWKENGLSQHSRAWLKKTSMRIIGMKVVMLK